MSTQKTSKSPKANSIQKRAVFWLVAPAGSFAAGILVAAINHFIPLGAAHSLVNVVVYLLLGFGIVGFIPGVIYGIILMSKK